MRTGCTVLFKWCVCITTSHRRSFQYWRRVAKYAHVMAWRHQATSYYLSQCWPRSTSSYGVTWPLWDKMCVSERCDSCYVHGCNSGLFETRHTIPYKIYAIYWHLIFTWATFIQINQWMYRIVFTTQPHDWSVVGWSEHSSETSKKLIIFPFRKMRLKI